MSNDSFSDRFMERYDNVMLAVRDRKTGKMGAIPLAPGHVMLFAEQFQVELTDEGGRMLPPEICEKVAEKLKSQRQDDRHAR